MEVILVKERDKVRILEGEGEVNGGALSLRSKLTGGDLEYYVLDYDESYGMSVDAYVAAINKSIGILDKSDMITKL